MTLTLAIEKPAVELEAVSDHDLLHTGLEQQVAQNRLDADRLWRWHQLRLRRERDYEARRADDPYFTPTALQETTVEVSELWGVTAGYVARQLGMMRALVRHFPDIWEMCRSGRLDMYRAGIIADAARHAVDHPEDFARLAERITAWLASSVSDDDDRPPLVNRTPKQIRNKVNYELNRIKPDPDERFRKAFAARRVTLRNHEDGTGSLAIGSSIDQVQLADYRLSLAAKLMKSKGDERTVEQLRADLAVDLILGRRQVAGTTGELEAAVDHDTGELVSEPLPVPAFARPIVNLTVPLQTVMGLGDEPGVLSGGDVVPPSLARMIAQQSGSTWHRMLTDPAGRCVELSTTSYRPTAPIWREVVARFGSCFRPNCSVPATRSELDHRIPYPEGPTSTRNLQPGCRTDHKVKHARGFGVEQADDGSLVLRTAAGFRHRREVTRHPVSDDWAHDELFEIQFSPTELAEALAQIRMLREWDTPPRPDLAAEEALVNASR